MCFFHENIIDSWQQITLLSCIRLHLFFLVRKTFHVQVVRDSILSLPCLYKIKQNKHIRIRHKRRHNSATVFCVLAR